MKTPKIPSLQSAAPFKTSRETAETSKRHLPIALKTILCLGGALLAAAIAASVYAESAPLPSSLRDIQRSHPAEGQTAEDLFKSQMEAGLYADALTTVAQSRPAPPWEKDAYKTFYKTLVEEGYTRLIQDSFQKLSFSSAEKAQEALFETYLADDLLEEAASLAKKINFPLRNQALLKLVDAYLNKYDIPNAIKCLDGLRLERKDFSSGLLSIVEAMDAFESEEIKSELVVLLGLEGWLLSQESKEQIATLLFQKFRDSGDFDNALKVGSKESSQLLEHLVNDKIRQFDFEGARQIVKTFGASNYGICPERSRFFSKISEAQTLHLLVKQYAGFKQAIAEACGPQGGPVVCLISRETNTPFIQTTKDTIRQCSSEFFDYLEEEERLAETGFSEKAETCEPESFPAPQLLSSHSFSKV